MAEEYTRPLISRTMRQHALGLTVSTALALAIAMPAQAAPVVGTSAAVKGSVFVSTQGAQRKAAVRDTIKLNDRVLTRDDSALQILLLDRTTFTVGQNCNMVIDKFVYDPNTSAGQISAKVTKGALRFMSGNIGKNNPTNASVTTPSATIGIRGTIFETIVGPDAVALAQLGGLDTGGAVLDNASIVILRGPGPGSNTLDDQGALDVTTNGGTASLLVPNTVVFDPGNGEAPIGPIPMTAEMQAYLDFFLRSTPSEDTENPLGLSSTGSQESGQDNFDMGQDNPDDIIEDEIENPVPEGVEDPQVPEPEPEPEPEVEIPDPKPPEPDPEPEVEDEEEELECDYGYAPDESGDECVFVGF